MPISLGELATRFGCELIGDPGIEVSGVASLSNANGESLTFLAAHLLRVSTEQKQNMLAQKEADLMEI